MTTEAFRWRGGDALPWIHVDLPDAKAAFSTRRGGVSAGAYRSLNLGILTDDDPQLVAENRNRLAASLGRDSNSVAMGLQVHGTSVEVHSRPPNRSAYAARRDDLTAADAQLTTDARVTALVLVADCLPLVLAARGVAGVVHCGWRGVAGGLVENAVDALRDVSPAHDAVHAALGPCIRSCCYEVGDDVAGAFRERGHAGAVVDGRLDLADAVRRELERCGVDPRGIHDCGLCTSCRADLFFSHRRDGGVTGRQAGLVWSRS